MSTMATWRSDDNGNDLPGRAERDDRVLRSMRFGIGKQSRRINLFNPPDGEDPARAAQIRTARERMGV